MSPRQATRYLLWFGEKTLAGDMPTDEEVVMFHEARSVSIGLARKYMRLKDEDWQYIKGRPFNGE